MRDLLTPIPDGHYELKSFSTDEGQSVVTAFAVFHGTQSGPGPADPPTGKTVAADYVYAAFDGDAIRWRPDPTHDKDLERRPLSAAARLGVNTQCQEVILWGRG